MTGKPTITDGLIKKFVVRGYARATGDPRHLLCKPDIIFVFFRLAIRVILRTIGVPYRGSRVSGHKKPPPEDQQGGSLRTVRGTIREIEKMEGSIGYTPGRLRAIV